MPNCLAAITGIDRAFVIENSSKEPRDVGFDNWNRLIERECGNGTSGVTTYAGQFADRSDVAGKNSTMSILHGLCGDAEILCPPIIA